MALPKASDNPFPSVLTVEGTTPASPSSGQQRLFVDSADHKLKRVNSSGAVTTIESTATGGATKLFDSTLGSSAATIDTGASGIPSGYALLEVYAYLRGDSNGWVRVNNDSTANYDWERVRGLGSTASAGSLSADNGWDFNAAIASNTANVFSTLHVTIPYYDGTVNKKSCLYQDGSADGAASNLNTSARAGLWRSTSAITRLAVVSQSGNWFTGSRLIIFGLN